MAIRGLWFALKNPLEIKIVSSVGKCFKSEITLFPPKMAKTHHHFFPSPKLIPHVIFMLLFFPKQLKTAKKFNFNIFPRFFFQIAKRLPVPRNFPHQLATFTNTNCV